MNLIDIGGGAEVHSFFSKLAKIGKKLEKGATGDVPPLFIRDGAGNCKIGYFGNV